jgi:polyhydroxybutyrate depolymerase
LILSDESHLQELRGDRFVNRLILGTLIATGLGLWPVASTALGGSMDQRQRKGERPVRGEGPVEIEVRHGGQKRTALAYVPSRYDGKSPVPLVLSFHGRHGQGKDQASLTEFHRLGERNNFIVVYPDGVGKSWNARHGTGEAEARGIDDVGYVDALLDTLSERYKIDQNRIYASGMSNGGFFAHRLGCERSNRFAAIASVAGEMAPALEKVCRPERPVPVMIFHGTRDRIVPFAGGKTDGGGSLLSADRTAEVWSRLNGGNGALRETFKKGDVVCRSSEGGKAPVTLCSVEGAGHTWPGGDQYAPRLLVGSTNRDVNASEMIWEFFQANPRR